jgi:membrane carboxypeptidase/penicillin-binding protein PbpC
MDDKALNGKEKMDKLMPLLNKEQKDVLKANKVQAKKNQDAFKTTLNKEQQEQFEKMKEKMGERMGDRKKGPNAKKPAGDERGK